MRLLWNPGIHVQMGEATHRVLCPNALGDKYSPKKISIPTINTPSYHVVNPKVKSALQFTGHSMSKELER